MAIGLAEMVPNAEPAADISLAPNKTGGARLAALDWMRGIVMLLMAVDHSSGEFNAGRLITDSAMFYKPHTPLPLLQFMTRWITHLCAPTFVFLAGASLALSLGRLVERGESAAAIDRHLLTRGVIIVALEIVPSYFWMPHGKFLFQVLYAIGTAYLFMIPLRRLPVSVLIAIAASVLVFGEAVIGLAGWGPPDKTPLLATLLLAAGPRGPVIVAYPTLPWLAIMLLGWGFGHALRRRPPADRLRPREFASWGIALIAIFLAVRGANSYGNMKLLREDGSLVQWLHVSKYPPSLTFVALELGIMALLLALLAMRARAAHKAAHLSNNPLIVFGQTPMFFYLLHIPLLALLAYELGLEHKLGPGSAYGFAALAALLLFPLCIWYRRYKAAHPTGLVRYF